MYNYMCMYLRVRVRMHACVTYKKKRVACLYFEQCTQNPRDECTLS